MLSSAQWQAYKNVVNQAAESFNQEIVTWYRFTRGFQRYGEDNEANAHYDQISLNCLIHFNIFRTWPMTEETIGGAIDQESIVMMLNKKYLEDDGYLNSAGFFDMDPGNDYFIHMGVKYRSAGETPVSQAGDEPLHFYIILKREETPTGTQKY